MDNLELVKGILERKEYDKVPDCFELIWAIEQDYDDKTKIDELVKEITEVSFVKAYHSAGRNISESNEWYRLGLRGALYLSPRWFDFYMRYVESDREPSRMFYLPRRNTLYPIVWELQRLADNELDILGISLPPGTGKSTLGIFYLSWLMGKFPEKPNLASAHGDKLTKSFFDGVDTIIRDPEYKWSDVFPGVRYESRNAKDETINLGSAKRFKTLTCRSIDGALTGATRCEELLYVDDLVSGIEEAMNKERMESLWVKYTDDLRSRKKSGCKELHIATRWSVHDPLGKLEVIHADNPMAKFICISALDENDESNFNYDYGVGYTTSDFHDIRNMMDDVSFQCLYQNQPIEREGQLYHKDELRRYYELPEEEPDGVVAICDTAEGGGDYMFMPIAVMYGKDAYIDDCVFNDGLPGITQPLLAKKIIQNKVQKVQFESNKAGWAIADRVQELIKELGGHCHITKKTSTGNKQTRIVVNSDWVKKHCLFKDERMYKPNSEYALMVRYLTSYSTRGKNKHDDAPDGMAQLAVFIQNLHNKTEITAFKRPF